MKVKIYGLKRGLLCLSLGLSLESYANKQLWEQQFSITMPERTRSIRLHNSVDAEQWLLNNNLDNANVLPLGNAGTLVDVPMDEMDWQRAQNSLCQQSEVQLCEVTQCRAIQLDGSIRSAQNQSADSVQVRIVFNDPEYVPLNESESHSCQAPIALALDETAEAAGRHVNLDVSEVQETVDLLTQSADDIATPTRNAATDTATSTGQPASAQGTDEVVEAAQNNELAQNNSGIENQSENLHQTNSGERIKRGFEYALESQFGLGGELLVDATELPEDTSDWTLVVGEGCNELRIPLDSLEPARRPGRAVALTDPGTALQIAAATGATVVSEVNLDTTDRSLVVFSTDDRVEILIATLLLDPRVSAAQRDFVYRTTVDDFAGQAVETPTPVYQDTFAALTYGPRFTRALELHSNVSGADQIIAVIDTGTDIEHPELVGRIHGEPINTTEFDWNADAHGTAIAGILVANAGNNEGIFGVAPQAKVLPIKACQPINEGGMAAKCYSSTLVRALDVAMSQGATLINMSLSGPPDAMVEEYINLALEKGKVIVAAAGNNGPNAKPSFPAAIPDVIAVTAVDANARLYRNANRGDYIDLAAPGVDIISPIPGGNYPPLSGTSMATAQVTGIAALLKELAPQLDGPQISQRLHLSTRKLGDRREFGSGLLDACFAAEPVSEGSFTCPLSTDIKSTNNNSAANDSADNNVGDKVGNNAGKTEGDSDAEN